MAPLLKNLENARFATPSVDLVQVLKGLNAHLVTLNESFTYAEVRIIRTAVVEDAHLVSTVKN